MLTLLPYTSTLLTSEEGKMPGPNIQKFHSTIGLKLISETHQLPGSLAVPLQDEWCPSLPSASGGAVGGGGRVGRGGATLLYTQCCFHGVYIQSYSVSTT